MGSPTIPLPGFARSATVGCAIIDHVPRLGIGRACGVRNFAIARSTNGELTYMSMRSNRTSRSLTLVGTLLLTTALAAPAFAQIEEVVVTAQKKAEDVQTVPIAISAFTAQDL